MEHNAPETEWDADYYTEYPYTVEIFCGDTCEDIYRTDSFSNAQAKFDSWTEDLQTNDDYSVKLFKYNSELGYHEELDYFAKVEYLWQHE